MKHTKGYLIIDENEKYVVGYVKENYGLRYIAYNKNEKCALRPFKTEREAMGYIEQLDKIVSNVKEHHKFSYKETMVLVKMHKMIINNYIIFVHFFGWQNDMNWL